VRFMYRLITSTPDEALWPSLVRALLPSRSLSARRYMLVVSSGPPHSAHILAVLLGRKLRCPVVLEFRDPWARAPWGPKPTNPWGSHLARHLEPLVTSQARALVAVTNRHRDQLRRVYRHLRHVEITAFPNGYDGSPDRFVSRSEAAALRKKWFPTLPSGRVLCTHAGSLYRKRDPRYLIRGLVHLTAREREKICFVHVGPVVAKHRAVLERAAKDLGCLQVIEPVSPDEVHEIYAASDAFWILQPGTAIQVPSKLYEVIPYGRPLLFVGSEGEASEIVRQYGLGLAANPANPHHVAAAIRTLLANKAHAIDPNGWRRAINDFNGRVIADKYARFLCELGGMSAVFLVTRTA